MKHVSLHVPLGFVLWIEAIHHFSCVALTGTKPPPRTVRTYSEKRQLKQHTKTRGEKSLMLYTGKHKNKQLKMTTVLCIVHGTMTLNALQKHNDTSARSIFSIFTVQNLNYLHN
jgi:hypothetical protein